MPNGTEPEPTRPRVVNMEAGPAAPPKTFLEKLIVAEVMLEGQLADVRTAKALLQEKPEVGEMLSKLPRSLRRWMV